MKIAVRHIVLIGVLLVQSASAQIRLAASVEDSEDIYVGQRFSYYIIVEDSDKPGNIDIRPLAKYDPQPGGTQNYSSSSFSNVNGRTTRVQTKRLVTTYQLLATQPGSITLPPVDVTIDGTVHTTNPVEVQVLTPETTARMDLGMSLSTKKCYTGQPIVFTVKWFIHSDIVNSIGDFNFNVPAFASGDFFIEDTDPAIRGNYNRRVSGTGVLVAQQPVRYKGADYAQVVFSKVLIPKRPGKIKLEPAIVSARIAVAKQGSRGFFGSRTQYKLFMAESESLRLEVLPVPQENKPLEFYGLVGKYTIETTAAPTSVYMGTPITLTIKIGGSSYLEPIQWPQLEKVDGFENFKTPPEKSSPVIQNGSKIFTQTIRANSSTVTEIPPIPLVYFDSEQGEYKTIYSEPIPLEVAATKKVGSGDIEGTTAVSTSSKVEAIKKGISANVKSLDALVNQDFLLSAALLSPLYLLFWALPLAGLLVSIVIKAATNKSPERIAVARRRRACKVAIDLLKKMPPLNDDQKRQLLIKTMRGYIGQRFDRSSGSLTASDCHAEILKQTGDEQTALSWQQIFENCQQSFYTGTRTDFDTSQITAVIELLRIIDRKAKR